MRNQEDDEVARVRAEVARALSVQPPDVALLSASLERVDALLAKARAELSAAVREMQLLPEVEAGRGRSEAAAESFPIGWHGSFPW
ncbi:MAG TPA: hypothetical protein VJV78_19240 [Polyangiales bacterium]|nr:hypothetical protein [Polyangiales bacterium]